MTACLIHISDLHRGTRETPALDDALVGLCEELSPEAVVASGDLANRGRRSEFEAAKALLDRLRCPTLVVPGNHDLPYSFPARFTSPWDRFNEVFETTDPVLRTDHAVICGLNSARPWRHQGGRLAAARLAAAAAALRDPRPNALRVVVLHHHLAGAPWRASRKFPLNHRDEALRSFAGAGAELVLGGHIHQSTAVARNSFEAFESGGGSSLVLATAPGFGRPRPRRLGEANGLHIVRWTDEETVIESRIWQNVGFETSSMYRVPRKVRADYQG